MKAHCDLSNSNLLDNLDLIRRKAPRSKIMAMVKDNAYGHGLISVTKLLEGKVDAFGIVSIEDALAMREANISTPITLMEGVFSPEELILAYEKNFSVVFHSDYQITWLEQCGSSGTIDAWLKIDTGMGRLGFSPEEAGSVMNILSQNRSVNHPVGIMSHMACADEPKNPLNYQQIATFNSFAEKYPGPRSLCNSAGTFAFPEIQFDWVRPGLALYGGSPLSGRRAADLGLKPVMTFKTELIAIQEKKKIGDNIGYGGHYICPDDMIIGIAAVGYGHGFPRASRDGQTVIIRGVRCNIISRVMMDMIEIDLRPCSEAKVGDSVTLWGEGLPIDEVAENCNRISYELLTGVRNRVEYIWK